MRLSTARGGVEQLPRDTRRPDLCEQLVQVRIGFDDDWGTRSGSYVYKKFKLLNFRLGARAEPSSGARLDAPTEIVGFSVHCA